VTLGDQRPVAAGARVPAVRRGRWLVDDLQIGRTDLAILSRSLHDRTGGVSVPYASDPAMPAEA
jgi:hypothetical protein